MNSRERRVPKRWSEDEDCILHQETQKQEMAGEAKDWHRIAAKLPGRTNKDCRKRWVNKVCGSLRKGPWNKHEDESLLDAVDRYGQRWTLVANEVGYRSPDQCAKRWQSKLDPNLEHGGWTPEEDELLLSLVKEKGREWKMFQESSFTKRSTNELKNRYTGLARKGKHIHSRSESLCLTPSSPTFSVDYNTDGDDGGMQGQSTSHHASDPSQASTTDSLMTEGLGVDLISTLDNPSIWMDDFHGLQSISEDLLSGYIPENNSTINTEELPTMSPLTPDSTNATNSTKERSTELANSTPWHQPTFNPEISSQVTTMVDSMYEINSSMLGDGLLPLMQGDSSGTSCADETFYTPRESSVGRVTLVIDGCNRDTLYSLLDLTKSLKGKTKIEIN
ncbi:Homeodomain-like protein [Astrocystis sublimbata]|nr:Homeodomain-like protein [Astrocystis sublimbata]